MANAAKVSCLFGQRGGLCEPSMQQRQPRSSLHRTPAVERFAQLIGKSCLVRQGELGFIDPAQLDKGIKAPSVAPLGY